MPKSRVLNTALAAAGVAALLFAHADTARAQGQRPPAPVVVAEVVESEVSASVDLVGSVRALKATTVSAEIAGAVKSFPKREGDRVEKGEAVCNLDQTLYWIKAREAKGLLDQAMAALEKSKLAARRATELYERKVASQENKQNADLDVEYSEASLKLRQAEYDTALYNVERTEIKAPYGGFITQKNADVGGWVEKGDTIFEIVETRQVEVIAEIPERQMAAATPGKEVQMTFDAYPDRVFVGEIAALVPKANLKTHTFPVRILLDNSEFLVKAGMFARVSIPSHEKKKALLIPRDAVVWRFRKALVFTADAKGAVRSIQVRLGRQYGEMVEASGGIEPGMKLIVTGNEILRDGQTVAVVGEKKL